MLVSVAFVQQILVTGLRPFWRVPPIAVVRLVAERGLVVLVLLPPPLHAVHPHVVCWNGRNQFLHVVCIDPEIDISAHFEMGLANVLLFAFWHFVVRVPSLTNQYALCVAVGALGLLPYVGVRSACLADPVQPLGARLGQLVHAYLGLVAAHCRRMLAGHAGA